MASTHDGDPFKDLIDAMRKVSEEMGKTEEEEENFRYPWNEDLLFRQDEFYHGSYRDDSVNRAYERWIRQQRFTVVLQKGNRCYRVTDLKSNIWLDVPESAVEEEERRTSGPREDTHDYVKIRAGRIANSLIHHKSKHEETRIISVTYPPAYRGSDFSSPETGADEGTSDVHLLRTAASGTRR